MPTFHISTSEKTPLAVIFFSAVLGLAALLAVADGAGAGGFVIVAWLIVFALRTLAQQR